MLDEKLRKLKDRWLRPLVGVAGGLSPNALTLLALAVGLASAGAAAQQLYGLGLALWAINRVLDGLDGAVARETGQQSDFGGYLDIVADFVVYAAVPIGFFLGQATVELGLSLALLLGSFYVNGASWMYLAAILEKRSAGAGARRSDHRRHAGWPDRRHGDGCFLRSLFPLAQRRALALPRHGGAGAGGRGAAPGVGATASGRAACPGGTSICLGRCCRRGKLVDGGVSASMVAALAGSVNRLEQLLPSYLCSCVLDRHVATP
jgi:hypothetical protein